MIGRPVLVVTRGLDAGVWGQTEFQVNLKLGLTPRRTTGGQIRTLPGTAHLEQCIPTCKSSGMRP